MRRFLQEQEWLTLHTFSPQRRAWHSYEDAVSVRHIATVRTHFCQGDVRLLPYEQRLRIMALWYLAGWLPV
jgi:hypothetical protein